MNDSTKALPAAPDQQDPTGTDDPEILALLDFEPVPRKFKKEDGWTAPLQRAFIADLARHGSPTRACEALGKVRSGVTKLYKDSKGKSFRDAWDRAVEIAERRRATQLCSEHSAVAGLKPPFVDHRRKKNPHPFALPHAGEGGEHSEAGEGRYEPLPVVCDKCGAEGAAGDDAFAGIPDILAFDPVPRRAHDKLWDAETQRAFIAALAVSGSPVRAARSIGRHALGAEKLRKARGARSFNEAWEAAMDIARERELVRLHGKLDQLAASPNEVGGEEIEAVEKGTWEVVEWGKNAECKDADA
jgi:hypothetical protein